LRIKVNRSAFRTLANPSTLTISDNLPSVLIAVWAKYVLLINGSRLYDGAKQLACRELVR
jgi:hypothetical protein